MEHVFIERLIGVFAPHRKENVSPDKLMDDFAVGRETIENDTSVIIELDHHMFRLPIDVPCLKNNEKKIFVLELILSKVYIYFIVL